MNRLKLHIPSEGELEYRRQLIADEVTIEDKYSEAYCSWNNYMKPDMTKDNPWGIIYR